MINLINVNFNDDDVKVDIDDVVHLTKEEINFQITNNLNKIIQEL